MCENCNYSFTEDEWIYNIYESIFCKNCISSQDKKLLENNSDYCFMTTYSSN